MLKHVVAQTNGRIGCRPQPQRIIQRPTRAGPLIKCLAALRDILWRHNRISRWNRSEKLLEQADESGRILDGHQMAGAMDDVTDGVRHSREEGPNVGIGHECVFTAIDK